MAREAGHPLISAHRPKPMQLLNAKNAVDVRGVRVLPALRKFL